MSGTANEQDCSARQCHLCNLGVNQDGLNELLGPFFPDKGTGRQAFVHRQCAIWSPEVFLDHNNALRNVGKALRRGRLNRCQHCGQRGATLGCRVERCKQSYHLPCARLSSVTFYDAKYLIACPKHAAGFREEQTPQQQRKDRPAEDWHIEPLRQLDLEERQAHGPAPGTAPAHAGSGGMAGGKRRWDALHREQYIHNARATYKRYKAEAWAKAQVPSDDEESFQRKEHRRLLRDTANLDPIILGKQGGGQQAAAFPEGWDSVGGLTEVVAKLKEMVILPLLYPEVYAALGTRPPGGILFHGPPGCGKTLAVRALAGACAATSPTPVALFARKGADCLGKWSGDAERTLRLLFDEASKRAPALVFLDELDGLVPVRSQRAGGQDQVFASVVSTLLALLDGLRDRRQVIVVGATNRPEAIDPALRRPGRFDREVYFPLPTTADRAAILRVHTRRWPSPPPAQGLQALARATPGWAGADLKALCASAVLTAVRRTSPMSVCSLHGDQTQPGGTGADVREDSDSAEGGQLQVLPQDWQQALAGSPPPCSLRSGLACLTPPTREAPAAAHHQAPLLLPSLACALCVLRLQGWALPPAATAAAESADKVLREQHVQWSHTGGWRRLEEQMRAAGGLAGNPAEDSEGQEEASESARPHHMRSAPPRCQILLAAEGNLGQSQAADALLRMAAANLPVHRVALPQLIASQQGSTGLAGACTALVQEALRRAAPGQPVVFFLPHVHAWASTESVPAEEDDVPDPAGESHASRAEGLNGHTILEEDQSLRRSTSGAFSVFKQLMRQASSRPILVVATSLQPLQALPLEVQAFFNGTGSSEVALRPGSGPQGAVTMLACSDAAWQEALARAAHQLAGSLAAAGVHAICAAASQHHHHQQQRQAHAESSQSAAAGIAHAFPNAAPPQTPATPAPGSSPGHDQVEQQNQGPRLQLNEADEQAAQRLCSQVDVMIRGCGQWLQRDRRAQLARPPARMKCSDWGPEPLPPPSSLPRLGPRAVSGEFGGNLDAFMAAVAEGVALVQLASPRKGSASSKASRDMACFAACALRDELETWSVRVRAHCGLNDPRVQSLLTHALTHPSGQPQQPLLASARKELWGNGDPSTPAGLRSRRFDESDSDDSGSEDEWDVEQQHGRRAAGAWVPQWQEQAQQQQQQQQRHVQVQQKIDQDSRGAGAFSDEILQAGQKNGSGTEQEPEVTAIAASEPDQEGRQHHAEPLLSKHNVSWLQQELEARLQELLQGSMHAHAAACSTESSVPALDSLTAALHRACCAPMAAAAKHMVDQLAAGQSARHSLHLHQAAEAGRQQDTCSNANDLQAAAQLTELLTTFVQVISASLLTLASG